jgi:hypothetical protein
MLGSVPQAEAPSSFRHDVIMRMARLQHERRATEHHPAGHDISRMLHRFIPLRTIAVASAAAALALVLLKVPSIVERPLTEPPVNTGSTVSPPAPGVIEASPLESSQKHLWVTRRIDRNSVWITIEPSDNGDGAKVYRVMLNINQQALLEGDVAARIGVRVYLLQSNKFDVDEIVQTGKPVWEGSILKDSPVVVPVVVDRSQDRSGTVNLLVAWRFRTRDFAQFVFIPTQSKGSSPDVFGLSMNGTNLAASDSGGSLCSALQRISGEHGIPIIVGSHLVDRRPVGMSFEQTDRDQAMRSLLEPIGLDWLQADNAIYVDLEWDVEVTD